MAELKEGGGARLKAPPIGVVKAIRFDERTGEKKILFAWADPDDGAPHEKWLKADALEAIDAEPDPVAPIGA